MNEVTKLFADLDIDHSNGWDESEYLAVLSKIEENQPQLINMLPTFLEMDSNSDNEIDFNEIDDIIEKLSASTRSILSLMGDQHNQPKEGKIEPTLIQNSNEKKLSIEEANARMEGKGLPKDVKFDDDGRMFKEVKGDFKIDNLTTSMHKKKQNEIDLLASKNPQVAQFVKLGRFVQDRLNEMGYAYGTLINLKSSPRSLDGTDINDQDEEPHGSGYRPVGVMDSRPVDIQGLILEISNSSNGGDDDSGKEDAIVYEAFVAINTVLTKEKRKMTRAALTAAWLLTESFDRENEKKTLENNNKIKYERTVQLFPLQNPSFYDSAHGWFQRHYFMLRTIFGVIAFSSIARFIRIGLTKLFYYFFPQKEHHQNISSSSLSDQKNLMSVQTQDENKKKSKRRGGSHRVKNRKRT